MLCYEYHIVRAFHESATASVLAISSRHLAQASRTAYMHRLDYSGRNRNCYYKYSFVLLYMGRGLALRD